ncbi:TonB-dependent receptor [Aquabacterium sp.]|uniref:TonB-dependent receptor n=1 Tax=Aquabacterium sp. TaxID=1872578 RepID=UPI0025B7C836|nr:TonB-dependent receptor [Aquabacterium sp.]
MKSFAHLGMAAPLCALAATAASTAATAQSTDDATLTLGQVTVSAPATGPLSSRRILTSVDVVGAEVLSAQNVDQSWALFGLVPGVMLTEFKQGTTSGKLSFRGFNGEGNVNAVKLLIDGIPSNTNDGNMPFLDLVSPLEIERIEVVRGTNDPRWGLHNIAGNAQVLTRQGGNEGEARVTAGSFGTAEVQLAKGLEGESGWSQNYFVGWRQSEGYRAHSATRKLNLAGKWFYQPAGEGWRAGLIARTHDARAEEAGYLTLAQGKADPTQSPRHNASDEDRRQLSQLSAHAEGELGQGLSWLTRAYRNQIQDDRYVTFSSTVSQQERDVRETHRGLIGSLTWRATPLWQLEGGLQREWQDNVSERYLTVAQVRSSQTRSQAFSFDTLGGYVQAVITPSRQWTILPAYRIDTLSGQLDNRLTGKRYTLNDYGQIRQPKLSVVFAPVSGHSLYANWGRSFQVGVGAASYKVPPRTSDLAPSLNEGWEFGWKFRPLPWLEGRLASWTQTATGEIYRKLNDPSGDSENLGATRRQGQDLQLNINPGEALSAWFSLSLQRAVIVEPDPSAPLTRGKEVDHVPHALASVGAKWRIDAKWETTAGVRAQSSYFLDSTNSTGRYGQFVVADVGVKHAVNERISLDLQVKNLFDRSYGYAWWDGSQSLHAPADGRAAYLSATVRF